jgi:GNAT superfamily N-acetyltransferase
VPGDADILARFNVELAKESENLALDPARVKAGVEALLRDPAKGTYFVAEAGGAVVGQLLITHEWSDWRNGDFWWLQSVYVRSDFRRRGVFQALFDHVLASAKRQGMSPASGFTWRSTTILRSRLIIAWASKRPIITSWNDLSFNGTTVFKLSSAGKTSHMPACQLCQRRRQPTKSS